MLSAAEFSRLRDVLGSPITWTQAKAPNASASCSGIIDSVRNAPEKIVQAYGVDGWQIQVLASDLPAPPVKFDTIEDGSGRRFVLDDVVAHKERGTGATVHYTCYAKGR